ncbi:MAG: DUF1800 family protein, partial [Gemmataceae bacterium]|nr:DUF1800 family protein [Gemmataceae bacterium]
MRARTIFSLLPAVTIAFLLPAAPLAAQSAKQPAGQDSLQPLSDSAWDYAKARHLLFRAGFGGPPEEVQKLCGLGLRKAVESLVDYRSQPDVEIPMAAGFKGLEPPDLVKLSPQERLQVFQKKKPRDDFQAMQELRRWWVTKMIRSPRPLEEKLVLFWHGLFAAEHRTVRNSISMSLQNQLFREHAAGNYAKLLHAILRDPAMLRYLDNNRNVKGKPNENLAREIMELFSMGEGQGYTEQDVREGARALTGYTFDPKTLQPRFLPKSHD